MAVGVSGAQAGGRAASGDQGRCGTGGEADAGGGGGAPEPATRRGAQALALAPAAGGKGGEPAPQGLGPRSLASPRGSAADDPFVFLPPPRRRPSQRR